jgi:hypothetical protein
VAYGAGGVTFTSMRPIWIDGCADGRGAAATAGLGGGAILGKIAAGGVMRAGRATSS